MTDHDCKNVPSTYYAHHKRQAAPAARTVCDAESKTLIRQAYETNYRVYGARKIWRHLNRQEVTVARCTVEHLMRELGTTGAVRGKKVITTISDASAQRAPDLVDRDFVAPAPNRCWVADFTHVATFAGVVYVAFAVDTFSHRIVGWSAATSKETRLVLDALEMAPRQRDRDQHPRQKGKLIHHSDAGSQYTSFALAEHLDRAGIAASPYRTGGAVLCHGALQGEASGAHVCIALAKWTFCTPVIVALGGHGSSPTPWAGGNRGSPGWTSHLIHSLRPSALKRSR
ncbi:IS3 family transposase [Streptomyces sp. NPDC058122]|uniref:IS3 family transposase n=1 Tax=Streptomyces sp. NPDC058122 TaxID=3346349 RepID=UPI0036E15D20